MDQSQSMGSMLAGIVATAVVQEVVSRGFSYVLGKRKERASMGMGDALEKLELAHSQLEFVLERSSKLPITNVSLLRRRMMIKHVYHECDVLLRSKRHALNDHHSSSFPLILGAAISAVEIDVVGLPGRRHRRCNPDFRPDRLAGWVRRRRSSDNCEANKWIVQVRSMPRPIIF